MADIHTDSKDACNKMRMANTEYAHYIKNLCEYLELSLNSFGKPLGYSGTHITRFERGTHEPTEDTIALICEVYGVDPRYFRGRYQLRML